MTALGAVDSRPEPVLWLRVRGPTGAEVEVEALVDTGYTGVLTLPMFVALSLRLPPVSSRLVVLADGSTRRVERFAAEVAWGESWRAVEASVLGDEAMAGMRLLAGHRLLVDAAPGGAVMVTPLPPPADAPPPAGGPLRRFLRSLVRRPGGR